MSGEVSILISRAPEARDLPLPRYATEGAAGSDLYAAVPQEFFLEPGQRAVISTGIRIALPDGYEAQVRPRSGLAATLGLGLLNAPGTIDSDYRGIISVIAINLGQEKISIRRGDRIAQLVVAPVARARWREVEPREMPPTGRQEGGFGHTGT